MKFTDDIETSDGWAEEDKDFLKSLEKMAEEVDSEVAEFGGKSER